MSPFALNVRPTFSDVRSSKDHLQAFIRFVFCVVFFCYVYFNLIYFCCGRVLVNFIDKRVLIVRIPGQHPCVKFFH